MHGTITVSNICSIIKRAAVPPSAGSLLRRPGQQLAPLRLREPRLRLDRLEVATLAGAVALADQDGADEAVVEEVQRAVPALVLVHVHLGFDVAAVLGREAELRDRLAAEDERAVLRNRVELLGLRPAQVRGHVVRSQLAVHAVGARRVVQQLVGGFVEHPAQEARAADQPVRLDAARDERLGQLVRDERAADRDADLRRLERVRDRQRVAHVLEVVDVLRALAARRGRRVRAAAGRQEQRIPRLLAAVRDDRLLLHVQRVDPGREPQIDGVLLVPGDVAHDHLLLGDLLAQQRRQRDPVVETVRLVREEDDGTSRVGLAQLFRAGRPREAVSDDDVPTFSHAPPDWRSVNPRLVNLLASFIRGSSDYALARLEFSMRFAERPAPPLLERLPDASEATLRERWDRGEDQLAEIRAYVKQVEAAPSNGERSDPAFRWLRRTVRELDQYARALRWVLTVHGGDPAP